MMLLDSNIVIYTTDPQATALRQFLRQSPNKVSAITKVEVLGFHRILEDERIKLEAFFSSNTILLLSPDIIEEAVKLRQQRKMSLGDVLVAATALIYDLPLVTRNTDDFKWIPNLKLINPFDHIP